MSNANPSAAVSQQPPPYSVQPDCSTVAAARISGQPNQNLTTAVSFPLMAAPTFSVGPKSMQMTCPHCRCRITTEIRHLSTAKTHIACLLLSWTLCCCCLPYCIDTCRNTNHFCPMCGAFIGTYQS